MPGREAGNGSNAPLSTPGWVPAPEVLRVGVAVDWLRECFESWPRTRAE